VRVCSQRGRVLVLSATPASDFELPLHLLVHAHSSPLLLAGEDVIPVDKRLSALQDVLVDASARGAGAAGPAEGERAPLALAGDLELHAAADGLGHAKRLTQGLHAYRLLGCLPRLEAGLERVPGRGYLAGRGAVEEKRVVAEAVAEGVV